MAFSDFVAAGSLLVAIVALIKSFMSDIKVNKLDIQLKEQELRQHMEDEADAKKANIEVEVIESVSSNRLNHLRFYNKGRASACNIAFEICSEGEDNTIILNIQEDYLPYPKLLPFQKFDVPFMNYGSKPHQTIKISWDDNFAKGRSEEIVVDM